MFSLEKSFDNKELAGEEAGGDSGFSKEALEKYDKIMGDETLKEAETETNIESNMSAWEKYDSMFEEGYEVNKQNELVEEKLEENIHIPHQEVVDKKINYYDDNGKLYRVEDDLKANIKYEINGYQYETDNIGRIISVEGVLHMKNREGRLPIRDSIEVVGKGDQRENDDRGHLIGDQFDGTNGLENLISQDANINRNDFKNFENDLASRVRAGDEVKVKIEPIYEGDSRRPTDIVVTYSINGIEDMRIFPNGEEI